MRKVGFIRAQTNKILRPIIVAFSFTIVFVGFALELVIALLKLIKDSLNRWIGYDASSFVSEIAKIVETSSEKVGLKTICYEVNMSPDGMNSFLFDSSGDDFPKIESMLGHMEALRLIPHIEKHIVNDRGFEVVFKDKSKIKEHING